MGNVFQKVNDVSRGPSGELSREHSREPSRKKNREPPSSN
jgi:hypothetical protein